MRKLCAILKCYRGGEWLRSCLESIKAFVDGIVIVQATKPWQGTSDLQDNCSTVASDFDSISIHRNCTCQEDSYKVGLNAILDKYGKDTGVLVIDSDEVWENDSITAVVDWHRKGKGVLRCHMHAYLKSPLYRVEPVESMPSVIYLPNPCYTDFWGRFSNLEHSVLPAKYAFHHFGMVRLLESEIAEKFAWTKGQEKSPLHEDWMERVWPHIPYGRDLHPTIGCESRWKRIRLIGPSELPVTVRNSFVVGYMAGREDYRIGNMRVSL